MSAGWRGGKAVFAHREQAVLEANSGRAGERAGGIARENLSAQRQRALHCPLPRHCARAFSRQWPSHPL
eukprot:8238289-Pyramimonas_sp.AAC.1